MTATEHLNLTDVTLAYGATEIVHNVSLTLQHGEIGCLLGPSGCGKSTLLRAIAGFEPVKSGTIKMLGRCLSSKAENVPTEKRNIGMVFQDIALFPHLSIADNISFGIRDWVKSEQSKRVAELLDLVGLPGVEARYPHSLSGGQQQRIALARAIAPKPDLLLLDEPFSGLDANLRETLVPEIRDILKHESMSAILVTHDQMEAFAMADKVAVMQQGVIQQWGTAFNIYHEPKTRFVADFIGLGEFLQATIKDEYSVDSALGCLIGDEPLKYAPGTPVELLIRPDDIQHAENSPLTGKIVSKWFRGSHYLYHVQLEHGEILPCITACHHDHNVGEDLGISIELDHLVVLPICDPETGVCDLQEAEVVQAQAINL
ncbi:ABC transporter ATP-binding protein [uncultured Neptuniibacter sp.]|uniref:ABC transporter ATP-binding protein n=1 Tax=uncultured Neptuniibacter sp. TaxID=502143 RepID=UPI002623D550|nr:ABC transporter ATP-binding protein [uncultured Neptuniibacter sp.]